jgi:hypothetical protein
MQITDIILVIENDKGTEKNLLIGFTEYMLQFGTKIEKTQWKLHSTRWI